MGPSPILIQNIVENVNFLRMIDFNNVFHFINILLNRFDASSNIRNFIKQKCAVEKSYGEVSYYAMYSI